MSFGARRGSRGMRFHATIDLHGKTATGIVVPAGVVEALGAGRRPPVTVTIGDHSYRTTVAARGDRFLVPVSAENRAGAGVAAGDEVDVEIVLDTASREVPVPRDLAAALDAAARSAFDALTPSQRKWLVKSIEDAKRPETRRRRVEKTVEGAARLERAAAGEARVELVPELDVGLAVDPAEVDPSRRGRTGSRSARCRGRAGRSRAGERRDAVLELDERLPHLPCRGDRRRWSASRRRAPGAPPVGQPRRVRRAAR